MKHILISIFVSAPLIVFSMQVDTIVVHDYTNVMLDVNNDGDLKPLTKLKESKSAGFFLQEEEGWIRICNSSPLSIWVNGRLYFELPLNECKILDLKALNRFDESETLFISLYAEHTLKDLVCEQVIFEQLVVVKDDVKVLRTQHYLREFNITSLVVLVFLFGYVAISAPSRIAYITTKVFSLKVSSYEFVSTKFLARESLLLLLLLSFILSYLVIIFNSHTALSFVEIPDRFDALLLLWIRLVFIISALFITKWILVSIIAKLFRFKEINNYQLFDFTNFLMVFLSLICVLTALDFVFNPLSDSWISEGYKAVFLIVLICFLLWFTLKFVNNSSRRKLLIISYLCATEIIPAIIIIGWFYK